MVGWTFLGCGASEGGSCGISTVEMFMEDRIRFSVRVTFEILHSVSTPQWYLHLWHMRFVVIVVGDIIGCLFISLTLSKQSRGIFSPVCPPNPIIADQIIISR